MVSVLVQGHSFGKRHLAFIVFLLTVHCSLFTLRAQSPEPADVLRIDTDLVTLNVSVFNRAPSQLPVTLQQKDFAILDDGKPQEIAFFESGESPFDLVLL